MAQEKKNVCREREREGGGENAVYLASASL